MNLCDTIVAVSSAVGPAARLLVRLAGPEAFHLLKPLAPALAPSRAAAMRGSIEFDGITCPAWVYTFVAPHSYTGDDLVEMHVPGNPLLARLLVERLVAAGARQAGPGEFTARAFLRGRLDLTEAEGVAMTIAATHAGELRAARQLMAGELSQRLGPPLEWLTEALALIESNLDFSEDDIAFIDADEVRRRITAALEVLDELTRHATRFERLAGEPTFVLVGLPNAGKSTLLNALAGVNRAVVSPVAGTTRDALSVEVALHRGLVRVIDVAGYEKGAATEIDRQMQAQARRTIDEADFIVEVRERGSPALKQLPRAPDLALVSKIDADPSQTQAANDKTFGHAAASGPLEISAITGAGMHPLRLRMDALAFGASASGGHLALTARHRSAIAVAHEALIAAEKLSDDAPELIAEPLRRAVDAIGSVLGKVTPDDVLARVFATFCVGK